jgi:hypothetical protein
MPRKACWNCEGAQYAIPTKQTYLSANGALEYVNTTIVLSVADPSFGKSPSNHYMACADKISTPDGGKTWVIPTINIHQSVATKDFDGAHRPGPIFCS